MAYEPITSSTDKLSYLDPVSALGKNYQQFSAQKRRKSIPNLKSFPTSTNEDSLLGIPRTNSNNWLTSLQNLTIDLSNTFENGFTSGRGGSSNFLSNNNNHQPIAGINSELSEDVAYNQKYTSN